MNQDPIAQAMTRLHRIMSALRAPGGCPWDAEQTPRTLSPYLIEEAYEVLEAIDREIPADIRDELGDLLLQVVFQAQIFSERGEFDLADVAHAISDKLERRHPQVFGKNESQNVTGPDQQWDRIKAGERKSRGHASGALEGIPPALPALLRAGKLLERTSRQGLPPLPPTEAIAALTQILRRFSSRGSAPDPELAAEDLGEFLLMTAHLAYGFNLEAEDALRRALARFTDRFRRLERILAAAGRLPTDCTGEDLALLWSELAAHERDNLPSQEKT
jgi:MazG family protein